MVTLELHNDPSQKLSLSDEVFSQDFNEPLVHQVVTAYLAAGRAGTRAQKTRSEVRGGGKKPWRQKGTGQARAGTIRSPLWRSGGVVFAAKPRSYAQKVNKKMYKHAVKSVLSELIRQNRVYVVENVLIHAPKTKQLVDVLKNWSLLNHKVFIISDKIENNVYLAARNLFTVNVSDPIGAISNIALLIKSDVILMTRLAITVVEGLLTV